MYKVVPPGGVEPATPRLKSVLPTELQEQEKIDCISSFLREGFPPRSETLRPSNLSLCNVPLFGQGSYIPKNPPEFQRKFADGGNPHFRPQILSLLCLPFHHTGSRDVARVQDGILSWKRVAKHPVGKIDISSLTTYYIDFRFAIIFLISTLSLNLVNILYIKILKKSRIEMLNM